MRPIKFKESNIVFGEGQEGYIPLPARLENGPEGIVITKWGLSLTERIRVLIYGRIWLSQMSFRNPLQPIYPTTKKDDFFLTPTPKDRLKRVFQKLKRILPLLCAFLILSGCTDRPEISEGYIVDKEYQPGHNRIEYNSVLKHVPDRWILWIANREGGVRIETTDSVFSSTKRGQFINIKKIKK